MDHSTPGTVLLIFLFIGPVFYFIHRAKRNVDIYIRRIPGIDAIDEGIGRAVELGRPLSFTTGLAGVGPVLYACLGVLSYIARKTATYGSRLLIPCNDPEAMALTEITVQNAFRAENKLAKYDPDSIRYLSAEQFAFASGYMGLVHREKIATAFLFGRYAAESLILAEAGQQVGAIQIAATISSEQIPFFITACDYTLVGEELYAAGAFLSDDYVQRGSLRGQDFAKLVVALLILIGIGQATYLSLTATVETPHTQQQAQLSKWIRIPWSDIFPNIATSETTGDAA